MYAVETVSMADATGTSIWVACVKCFTQLKNLKTIIYVMVIQGLATVTQAARRLRCRHTKDSEFKI